MSSKYVYFFGNGKADGRADMKALHGGKGANLAEMTNIGLPGDGGDGAHVAEPCCLRAGLGGETAALGRPQHRVAALG